MALNVYLFVLIPKGFFPQQDRGRLTGQIQADQDTSFQAMQGIAQKMVEIIQKDPAVATINGYTGGTGGGGSTANTARIYIQLKPLEQRQDRSRLRAWRGYGRSWQRCRERRCTCRCRRISGWAAAQSSALYQFTMRGDNLQDLTDYGAADAAGDAAAAADQRREYATSRTTGCNRWCSTTA